LAEIAILRRKYLEDMPAGHRKDKLGAFSNPGAIRWKMMVLADSLGELQAQVRLLLKLLEGGSFETV
jgi:hypothetical protein